jgi:hypothetical protein
VKRAFALVYVLLNEQIVVKHCSAVAGGGKFFESPSTNCMRTIFRENRTVVYFQVTWFLRTENTHGTCHPQTVNSRDFSIMTRLIEKLFYLDALILDQNIFPRNAKEEDYA